MEDSRNYTEKEAMNSPQESPPLHMEAQWEVNNISPQRPNVNNISLQRTNTYIVYQAPDLVDSCEHNNIFSNSEKARNELGSCTPYRLVEKGFVPW